MSKEEKRFESLACELTVDEVAGKSAELAALHGDVERMEADLETERKTRGARIKTAVVRQGMLARQCRERREYRDVEVTDVADFDEKVMATVRIDTGEPIRQRPLSEAELQRPLPMGARKKPARKGK